MFPQIKIAARRFFRVCSTALTLSILLAGFASALDTGHHFDLTGKVLSERGFGEDAVRVAQVENWLTDYYSNSPTYKEKKREILELLHFDNLYDRRQIVSYWRQYLFNLKAATEKAARENDELQMLVVLGIGLHSTQDFYAHSNWVETHPRIKDGPYRTDTILSAPGGLSPAGPELFSGRYPAERTIGPDGKPVPKGAAYHGDYETGLNKDSPIRNGWDEALVFAYCSSHEITAAIEAWAEEARPGFWKRVREFKAREDADQLDHDIRAARNISMWFKAKGQDGHWKGDKSGTSRFFTAFSSNWVSDNSSRYVRAMRDGTVPESLAKDLYSGNRVPDPGRLPRYSLDRRVLVIHTSLIKEVKGSNILRKTLSGAGGTDFYAVITVGKQRFDSRVLQKTRQAVDPWSEIAFVDESEKSIQINISIWDEDGLHLVDDRQIDINPREGKLDLDLIFDLTNGKLKGDVNGIFDRPGREFESAGAKPDKDLALIRIYIAQFPMK